MQDEDPSSMEIWLYSRGATNEHPTTHPNSSHVQIVSSDRVLFEHRIRFTAGLASSGGLASGLEGHLLPERAGEVPGAFPRGVGGGWRGWCCGVDRSGACA